MQPAGGAPRLWVRNLDALHAEPLAGTEGASAPFWAPDGRSIAFFANGQLLRVNATGGTPVRIADAPAGETGTWGTDNAIYFSTAEGIQRIDVGAAGGARPRLVFRSDSANRFERPSIGDDRRFLVLTSVTEVLVGDARTGNVTRVVKDPAYDAQLGGENTVVYVGLADALFLQRIDLAKGKLVGEPIEIGGPVRSASNLMSFTTPATGTSAYLLSRPLPGPLVVDRKGTVVDSIRRLHRAKQLTRRVDWPDGLREPPRSRTGLPHPVREKRHGRLTRRREDDGAEVNRPGEDLDRHRGRQEVGGEAARRGESHPALRNQESRGQSLEKHRHPVPSHQNLVFKDSDPLIP